MCVVCGSRFDPTNSSSGRGGDRSWRHGERHRRASCGDGGATSSSTLEAGSLACRVRCCVSASMTVVGPFREMQCEQLVSRGKKGSQAPASVQRDWWGGSGGEREVQVRGRRRGGAASSASPSPRHAGTARAVSRSRSERRLRPSSRGEENMRSLSQRGRTLLPGAKRLMRNREDGERGAARVRSRSVRGRQPREAPSRCLVARGSRSPPSTQGEEDETARAGACAEARTPGDLSSTLHAVWEGSVGSHRGCSDL